MPELVYGVPKPRGINRAWEATSMVCFGAGEVMRRYHTPADWGTPAKAVAWFASDNLRVMVCDYPNGRRATLRKKARNYTIEFGLASQPAQTGGSHAK